MDPFTHTFLGATLARTRWARETQLGTAALLIGANLPDLDALAHFGSLDTSLSFRRGWTHGAPALLLLPCLLALALFAWKRFDHHSPGRLFGLALLGVWSHPLLDWLNTYGIRLLYPLDERWFYGDTLFILDPWLWLFLGGGAFLGGLPLRRTGWLALAILLSIPVVAAPVPQATRWIFFIGLASILLVEKRLGSRSKVAAWSLVLAALYIAGMFVSSRAARSLLEREHSEDVLLVGPLPGDALRWDILLGNETHYVWGHFSWLDGGRLELRGEIPRGGQPSEVVEAALASDSVRGFVGWMKFPFIEVEERKDGGYDVYLMDARYTRQRTAGFGGTRIQLDAKLRPVTPHID